MKKLIILYFLAISLFSLFFIHPIKSDLFFSHLSIGESIMNNLSITTEKLSFLREGQYIINHYWLYDIFLYLGFFIWGVVGYYALPATLWSLCSLSLWRSWILFLALTLAIYPLLSTFLSIPVLIYFTILLFLLQKPGSKQIYALSMLQILWVNSHSTFVIAPLFILIWKFYEKDAKTAIYEFLMVASCSLINPYGYHIFLSLTTFLTIDLMPWFWPGYSGIVILTTIIIVKEYKKFAHLQLLFLLSILISIFFMEWAIAVVFISGQILSQIKIWEKKMTKIVVIAMFLVLSLVHIWSIKEDVESPIKHNILDYTKQQDKVYNDKTIGGVLFWQNKKMIFADERNIYPKSVDEVIMMIRYYPESFKDIANRYNLTTAVIDYQIPYSKNICVWLTESLEWELVYCDPRICVFAKNNKENGDIISKYKINNGDIAGKNYNNKQLFSLARFFFEISYIDSGKKIQEILEKNNFKKSSLAILHAYNEIYEGNLEKACQYLEVSLAEKIELKSLQLVISNYLRTHTIENRNKAYKWISYANTYYPDDPEIAIYKAQVYHFKEDFVSALSTLRNIIKVHPYYEPAKRYYENLKYNQVEIGSQEKNLQLARLLFAKGQYQQALRKLEAVLAVNEDFVEAQIEIGKIYHKLQQYDQAKEHYQHALKIVPGNKEAISYLAITLAVTGNWQEAKRILDPIATEEINYIQGAVSVVNDIVIRILEKEIQKSPKDASLRVRICKILAQERRYQEAISYFENIPEPNPVFLSGLYYEYGKEVLNEKQVKEGLELLHKAVGAWSKNADAYLLIGTIELKKKNWLAAEKYYNEVLHITPSDARAKEGLALIEQGKGIEMQVQHNYQKAIEHFKKFIEKSSDQEEKKRIGDRIKDMELTLGRLELVDLKNLYNNGENAIRKKDWDRAVSIYETIIKKFPDSPQAYYGMAIAYTNQEKYQKAIETLHLVLEKQKHFPKAHDFLAGLYLKIGDSEKAMYHMNLYNEQKSEE